MNALKLLMIATVAIAATAVTPAFAKAQPDIQKFYCNLGIYFAQAKEMRSTTNDLEKLVAAGKKLKHPPIQCLAEIENKQTPFLVLVFAPPKGIKNATKEEKWAALVAHTLVYWGAESVEEFGKFIAKKDAEIED